MLAIDPFMPIDRRTILALAAAGIAAPALARLPDDRGRVETIAGSAFLTLPRFRVRVWTPPGFAQQAGTRRSLYLLDGQYAFAADSDGVNFAADRRVARLIADGTIEPTLIVAIDNLGDDRFLQYMPQSLYDRAPAAIRAVVERERERLGNKPLVSAEFVRFLATDLKPFIDRRFGTSPDRLDTAIFGASQAGVMAGAIFVDAQESFGRAACMSPNWAIYDERMIDVPGFAEIWSAFFARLSAPEGRRLWLDHGTRMMDAGMGPHQAAIAGRLGSLGWKRGCNLQTRVYEAGHAFAQTALQMDEVLAWLLA